MCFVFAVQYHGEEKLFVRRDKRCMDYLCACMCGLGGSDPIVITVKGIAQADYAKLCKEQ